MQTWIKIIGVPDNYLNLSFGDKLPYRKKINDFVYDAKTTEVSIKGRSAKAALKEFKDLYKPTQYYAKFHDSPTQRDDVFTVKYL